ncbi:hypothetical protein RJ639_013684 [Escallonia herrerae]|uniref:Uncharacterized protein n=1 Tax=Escallonia herrerae TaxID=1293975 RepID=A0AA89ANP0_9ASTE|nr:hypothetical protein RJ639_013684 [Escallonia herrerae]
MVPGQLVPDRWRKLVGLFYLVKTSVYKADPMDFMEVFFALCFVKFNIEQRQVLQIERIFEASLVAFSMFELLPILWTSFAKPLSLLFPEEHSYSLRGFLLTENANLDVGRRPRRKAVYLIDSSRLSTSKSLKAFMLSNLLRGGVYAIYDQRVSTVARSTFRGLPADKEELIFDRKINLAEENVFVNLKDLEQLVAHSNSLSGPLPSTLAQCLKLEALDLRNNSMSGLIGLDFTGLRNLHTLDLASNKFSGALSILQHCKNLTILILKKNFHREEIPKNVSGFESLVVFALGNCALNGQIPVWLLSCKKLQVLDLSWNRLNGSIPPWIGQMESLFYLDFSNNTLTGEIPKSLTQLKSLIS